MQRISLDYDALKLENENLLKKLNGLKSNIDSSEFPFCFCFFDFVISKYLINHTLSKQLQNQYPFECLCHKTQDNNF